MVLSSSSIHIKYIYSTPPYTILQRANSPWFSTRCFKGAIPQVLTRFRDCSEVRPTLALHDDDTNVIGPVIITCARG